MCVHSHSSVNLRKYHVNYLPAAVKDENTITMATAMKNANDTTLATLSASTIVLLGTNYYMERSTCSSLSGWVLVHSLLSSSPSGYIYLECCYYICCINILLLPKSPLMNFLETIE